MTDPWIPNQEDLDALRRDMQSALATETIMRPDSQPDLSRVPGHLFKPSGKWKYEVFLDYRDILDVDGKPVDGIFLDPKSAALRALEQATDRGTSGVSLRAPGDYHLVVIDPPNGFPVMVVGGGE